MNSYPFGLIMDNKKVMDCVILVKSDSVRFMFEEPVVFYKGKDKGTNFEITDTQVKNPYGYVVDRIKRIVDRNPNIVGVMIEGEEVLVTDHRSYP